MIVQGLNKNKDQLNMNLDVTQDNISASDGIDEDDAQLEDR